MKRFLSLCLMSILFSGIFVGTPLYATNFEAIPEASQTPEQLGNTVDCVAGTTSTGCVTPSNKPLKGKTVRDRYNQVATDKKTTLGDQFATGIFSWDGVLQYIVEVVKLISEGGILIGALMIIVAWYKYASAVFTGKTPSMKDVQNAIVWVLIIIFSYAIIRGLTAAFL